MGLKPIGERVIVEVVEIEETTASGLVLPDSARKPHTGGTVVAVGSKVEEVSVGDQVIFFPMAGTQIDGYPDLRLLMVHEIQAVRV
jgi:chaperonin GroES